MSVRKVSGPSVTTTLQLIRNSIRSIPVSSAVRHTAEVFGLDPLTVANEGKLVAICSAKDADRVLNACRAHPLGKHAALIGHFVDEQPQLVELITLAGGRRVIQRPYGEELPRIC